MPQVFQVLRCYKCLAFQVHQIKKSNKWECKLCGEKQSIKRHYGIGTGKECRIHVQKLNELRNEIIKQNPCYIDSDDGLDNIENNIINNIVEEETTKKSKWSNYIQENSETNAHLVDEERETLFGKEVVFELTKNHKKGFRKNRLNKNETYKKNLCQKGADEEDILCNSVEVSAEFKSTSTQKKQIHTFIPPTAQLLKSKWTEYNESECFDNQTDNISNSDIYNKSLRNHGDLCTNIKTNNPFKSDTPNTVIAISKTMYKNNQENDMNFDNKCVDEEHKHTSKWTEFMDNTEHEDEHGECSQNFEYSPKKDTASIKPINLFSLCDDNDLDTFLDI